jgi:hypothetical protein
MPSAERFAVASHTCFPVRSITQQAESETKGMVCAKRSSAGALLRRQGCWRRGRLLLSFIFARLPFVEEF